MNFPSRLAIGILLICMASSAAAQRHGNAERKVYCWDEGGQRVCGDALPASAVNAARTEIDARSGLTTARVDRALSAEEREAAEAEAKRARLAAEAVAARERQALAMVESYATEEDLRRAYGERIALTEETIKTSRMGADTLRASLVSLLQQAGERELAGQPVPETLVDRIKGQRAELQRQLSILGQQQTQRAELDGDLEAALSRYRDMKAASERRG